MILLFCLVARVRACDTVPVPAPKAVSFGADVSFDDSGDRDTPSRRWGRRLSICVMQ